MPSPVGWGNSSWGYLWGSPGTTEVESITASPEFFASSVSNTAATRVTRVQAFSFGCTGILSHLLVNGPATIVVQ